MKGETVSLETDWFTLKNARLQLDSYSKPMMEMAVTSIKSPAGAISAGKFGAGLLVLGGMSDEALKIQCSNWEVCQETAKSNDQMVGRNKWRITVMTHLSDSLDQAKDDLQFGLKKWLDYSHNVLPNSPFPDSIQDPINYGIENKILLVGTPEDAIREIERIDKITGGFGVFLMFAHNFVPWEAAKKSYELMARYVIPYFRQSNSLRQKSYDVAKNIHERLQTDFNDAVKAADADYKQQNKKD